MKKILLWSSCVLLFLSIMACSKESEAVLLLSAHTWVVASGSPGGTVGDEYKFHDNRLYFHIQNDVTLNDGKWEFDGSPYDFIDVNSDLGMLSFRIEKLTSTELRLYDYTNFGPVIVLEAKK